jgi:transcriptional regulator with XRE-family HTH domain
VRTKRRKKLRRFHPLHKQVQEYVGHAVKHHRTAQGLTLVQLAEKAQVSEKTIRRMEHGEAPATIATLAQIASSLELSVQDLVPGFAMTGDPAND